MKQSVSRYAVYDKVRGQFMQRIEFVGHGKNGQVYEWHFTDRADEASHGSKKFLSGLLDRKTIDNTITKLNLEDLEIRKLKVTYEY